MRKIKILTTDDISELSGLINNHPFRPFSYYPNLSNQVLSDCLFLEILNTVRMKENYLIGLQEKKKIIAFCVLKKSEIESDILKKKIFYLSHLVSDGSYTSSLKNKMRLLLFINSDFDERIDMLSCRTGINDFSTIHALEKTSFQYMDSLVTYSFENPRRIPDTANPFCTIRLSQQHDLKKLKEIAKNSFSIDRFHNDPRIPKKDSDRIYERFVENAARGIGADRIMVAEHDNEVVGFNTIELPNCQLAQFGIHIGAFILSAVSSAFRNKGIYSCLIRGSLLYLNHSADIVEVRTQIDNYPVHRSLTGLGFKLTTSQFTFHRWNSRTIY